MRQTFVSGFLIFGVLSIACGASAQAPAPRRLRPAPSPAAVHAGAPLSATSPPGADRHAVARPIPQAAPRALAVRFTLSPEWGYRTFRDHEPSSTDKRYTAAGVPGASARFELYPLAFVSPAVEGAKDIGLTGSYSRAFGLKSRDIDTDSDVDTDWYQFSFGLRYRVLGGTKPLALGFTLGIQRSVFDFAATAPGRPIPIGRYTLLPVGADARYAWGDFSLFADGRFLLPLTVSPLGDRTPSSGGRFGFNVALGAALAFWRVFEVELRATYTLLSLSLPTVAGRADQPGNVIDQYLVFGAGATFRY